MNPRLDESQVPEPVLEDFPGFIKLYWKAWEYARNHVYQRADVPQSPYMDEALHPDTIWIWDTCFMTFYCKYAPQYFPGIESLNNFYLSLYDGVDTSLKIQHVDNPPLFAWAEWEYFKFTGDVKRLKWVLLEGKYLQKHFNFIKNGKRFRRHGVGRIPRLAKKRELGYQWAGTPSGMDNTPRGGRLSHFRILWLDLLAQQGLSARLIAKMAKVLKQLDLAGEYSRHHEEIKAIMNGYYWNEEDGIYYDIKKRNPEHHVEIKTPASYWPLLADMCDESQATRLAEKARDPNCFGGDPPWPSVSRDDPDYHPEGMYWRGGVWLPMAYMATKALERHGHQELADRNAERLLVHMLDTYEQYEPHTIWEVYSPSEPRPATYKQNKGVFRPEFCGWAALGPISMLIENVLGFHEVMAHKKVVKWRLHRTKRHGIKRLRFGMILTDLLYEDGNIDVQASESYLLVVNGEEFKIDAGIQQLSVEPVPLQAEGNFHD